jgi:hypothetical protein
MVGYVPQRDAEPKLDRLERHKGIIRWLHPMSPGRALRSTPFLAHCPFRRHGAPEGCFRF